MQEAVEVLRGRGHTVTSVTNDAIVDGVPDERGRLPANPDTGPGTKPGMFTINCDGAVFNETFFVSVSPQTAEAFADAVEASIEGDE